MLDEKQIQNLIKIDYSNFPIDTVELVGEGCDSAAFLINGKNIFLFAKQEENIRQSKIEASLLPLLSKYVTAKIPDIKFASHTRNVGSYIGYEKLTGEPLEKEYLLSLSFEKRHPLIKGLVQFLVELHSFPVDIAKSLEVKVIDCKVEYEFLYKNAIELLYPLVNDTTKKYLEELFKLYLSDPNHFSYSPSLIHADLSPGHILYDSAQNAIAGIIDFGDIQITDPHYDLKYFLTDYGTEITKEIIELYSPGRSKKILEKVDFFVRCENFMEIIDTIKTNEVSTPELDDLQKEAVIWETSHSI